MEVTLVIIIVLIIAGFALLYWRASNRSVDYTNLLNRLDNLRDFQERTDRLVREEFARSRVETQTQAQQERTELARSFKSFEDSVQMRLAELTAVTEKKSKMSEWLLMKSSGKFRKIIHANST